MRIGLVLPPKTPFDRIPALARRAPDAVEGAVFTWGNIDPEPGRAKQVGVETLQGLYRQDMTRGADRYLVFGTPEQAIARFTEYAEAGASTLVFALAAPDAEADAVVELFATEVAPALRSLPGSAA